MYRSQALTGYFPFPLPEGHRDGVGIFGGDDVGGEDIPWRVQCRNKFGLRYGGKFPRPVPRVPCENRDYRWNRDYFAKIDLKRHSTQFEYCTKLPGNRVIG